MMDSDCHILYATPLSQYAGKARSYLIKNRIPYLEHAPISRYYAKEILPQAQLRTIPVIETVDGLVIRDSTAIVDYFESKGGCASCPEGPCQRIISRLFDVMGLEGLLRPAMHYRWSFPKENQAFVEFHFQRLVPPGADVVNVANGNMQRMRQAAIAFGVVPDNFSVIESLYETLIEKLDSHFACYPYLLGYRPCLGDYGMIAPFYAHLGRDPKPLALMQAKSIRLFRWVERMNRPEPDIGEFFTSHSGFLPADEIPDTLKAVLKQWAIDFVPETLAAAECINEWLATQQELPTGTPIERGVGYGVFTLRGKTIKALAQPHRFYLLRRVQDEFESMADKDQSLVKRLFDECDLEPLLRVKLSRAIKRDGNLEVWV